jgi:hypothetical protein
MKKSLRIVAIAIAVFVAIFLISWQFRFDAPSVRWGVTWSEFQAKEALKLPDWRGAYRAMLDDLRPQEVRLIAYWEYVEPKRGTFDFGDLDWQVAEAAAHGAEVALVIGKRVPRWPECHIPPWVSNLGETEIDEALSAYLKEIVVHYAANPAIKVWQVENEPFLTVFGDCPHPSRTTLLGELSLVKSLDPTRPIMVTDSGELSLWRKTTGLSEILGTTVYRTVWNKYIGWWKHVYPPAWYALRAALVRMFSHTAEVVVAELQAEPWPKGDIPLVNVPFAEQTSHFDLEEFARSVDFAKAAGFSDVYFWGAEWWYWRKVNGDPGFWDAARELLSAR